MELVDTVECEWTVVGGKVTFCITISNLSDIDLANSIFRDVLNMRLTYIAGTFKVDNVTATPTVDENNILQYTVPLIEGGTSVVICFDVLVGPQRVS